jgi:Flp pilus assembly pilin Flp
MQTLLKALWTDESGQDTTEYVLLVALIALAVYVLLVALIALAVTAGMILLADNINEAFSAAGSTLDSHTP